MRWQRIFIVFVIIIGSFSVAVLVYCDKAIIASADGKIYADIDALPRNHVGLLLGTGKYLTDGSLNYYYEYRVNAAEYLMKEHKIDYLVISGDNSRKDYNEPEMMKQDLIKSGVDSSRIYLDFAGFRTFDSMVRLKEIFNQDSVTIISQDFHNQRALFIAGREGITAVAFNARDVTARAGFKTQLREKFARVKVFSDYLFNVQPKFLGPKVSIP